MEEEKKEGLTAMEVRSDDEESEDDMMDEEGKEKQNETQ